MKARNGPKVFTLDLQTRNLILGHKRKAMTAKLQMQTRHCPAPVEIKCYQCGGELREGERIVSKLSGKHLNKTRHYHYDCAERLNLI